MTILRCVFRGFNWRNHVSQSEKLPITKEGRKVHLSWSNYITLMRILNIEDRHFYEIEVYRNGWNTRELARK